MRCLIGDARIKNNFDGLSQLFFAKRYYFNKIYAIIDTKYKRRCVHMAYVINDACISCGACEPECPVSAITAGDSKYVIDENTCIDCGACAGVCPTSAPNPA